jgi:2-methylisocitrate lyase-like PEP mutase family enzyme
VSAGDRSKQAEKAKRLLELHQAPRLLVLPNVWDALGARLLQGLNYPAVATASASVAYSLGYDDGQQISWDAMVEAVRRVASAVDVPVTADIEAGYADRPEELAANVRQIMDAGAVGINIEDSRFDGDLLHSIPAQQERLRAVRAMADAEGIPLVINARTDVYLREITDSSEKRLDRAIDRARAYLEAGADCFYPILLDDLDALKAIRKATGAPLNVYASASAPSVRALEDAGIARLSLGPGLLKVALTAMKDAAEQLQKDGSYRHLNENVMSSEEVEHFVRKEKMQ